MDPHLTSSHGIRLAVEGCGHGTLHAIYASIEESCKQKGWPDVDLVIIGGDFQAVRNAFDLNCVSMPAKYRDMCDFHEYYSGERKAPYLTVFVGGNHEASNYLFELYYGGWVAPNIYYLGAANVLRLGTLRIAGLSGIWKGFDYRKPHFERLPYSESDVKSIYHVRELDVRKLACVRTQVDVGISHDWPQGVEWKGDWKKLFRFKKFLEDDARSGRLGSVAAKQLMHHLRPRYWFSAHLHCKYAAVVSHGDDETSEPSLVQGSGGRPISNGNLANSDAAKGQESAVNTDEIDLDLDDESAEAGATSSASQTNTKTKTLAANADEIDLDMEDGDGNAAEQVANSASHDQTLKDARAALPASFRPPQPPEPTLHPPDITNRTTNFLALDKCLPNRHFLQLALIPSEDIVRPLQLSYDREWLSITRAFALAEPPDFGKAAARVPPAKTQSQYEELIAEQRKWIGAHLESDVNLIIPENFAVTAPVYDGGNWQLPQYQQSSGGLREYTNPQTAAFCEMLDMPNPLHLSDEERDKRLAAGPAPDANPTFTGGRGRGNRGGRGRGGGRRAFRGR